MLRKFLPLAIVTATLMSVAAAENWPAWRGPRGDGTSLETTAPTQWSATQNIVWKTEIPGEGHSSAVVWGNRIFTATALLQSKERCLVCLDRATGKILWNKTVITSPLEAKNQENSYASGTPATDGTNVYVTFLDGQQVVVAAYDFEGKQLWLARPGEFQNDHGFSTSLVLYEGKVIVTAQSKKGNFLAALNCADGKVAWKTPLENPSNSFGLPLIRTLAGRPQIILCGDKAVTSFDPKDGARIWYVENISTDFVMTPVFNEKTGLLLTGSSWPKKELQAIKPDGQGEVAATKVAWKSQVGAPYVVSPISVGDYFLTLTDPGEIYCLEAATGRVAWHTPFGRSHASPVVVGGKAYFLNDKGLMRIIEVGEKYNMIAENELGERCFASTAISGGQIFQRTAKNLYCIGQAGK